MEVTAFNESVASVTQEFLLLGQDLRHRRRLRHVLRSVRHSGEQVELHLLLQLIAR